VIFYCATFTDTHGQELNRFDKQRAVAIKVARDAARRGCSNVRVVKVDPQGSHQICELLNVASGTLEMHADAEVVWKPKPKTKAEQEDLLS